MRTGGNDLYADLVWRSISFSVVSGTTPPGAQGSAVCRHHHHHYHHYEMQCQTESCNCDRSPVILCRCIRFLRSCADPPWGCAWRSSWTVDSPGRSRRDSLDCWHSRESTRTCRDARWCTADCDRSLRPAPAHDTASSRRQSSPIWRRLCETLCVHDSPIWTFVDCHHRQCPWRGAVPSCSWSVCQWSA